MLRGQLQDFGLEAGVGDASGEDEMMVVSLSLAAVLWNCIYILGHVTGGDFFSPVGGIVAGEAEAEVRSGVV